MSELDSPTPRPFRDLLHSQRVWDTELPPFEPASAPAAPAPLFHAWFAEAVAAGQAEPHTMSLATADAEGLPDVRTLMLHDADERGWHFATHATSAKGRQLAARPYAALGFYWPALGRQVRVRGPVVRCMPAESHADLHARSTGALAAALTGAQSEVVGSVAELHRAADAAWDRARAEPDTVAPTWTRYVVEPAEVEFFQGDARRRHIRLRYRRQEGGGWARELLWP
ncbi:pyridoxine/pyridoxamine 5'-phosphate oxidase [Streptomyces anulatus]|uniref:pyridoxine/pyridoxamine 5'-phosphate oxidase n=1 Tax=Streptomyces anulatus TaxID=1892 RepID=UPI001C27B019|nr:pyridoxal 5'-phosphate synthase [Streptomyces anulatus]